VTPQNPKKSRPRGGAPEQVRATSSPPARAATDPAARIYAVVRKIPRGKVATYGQLALLAGIPAGHRIAAKAMQTCPAKLPWQRVLGKKDARRAQINIQDPDQARLQRRLLEAEGVVFDERGFVSLREAGWLPC
jgi:methylated-DNA-protein-cysteine methyltransferase related protein